MDDPIRNLSNFRDVYYDGMKNVKDEITVKKDGREFTKEFSNVREGLLIGKHEVRITQIVHQGTVAFNRLKQLYDKLDKQAPQFKKEHPQEIAADVRVTENFVSQMKQAIKEIKSHEKLDSPLQRFVARFFNPEKAKILSDINKMEKDLDSMHIDGFKNRYGI